MDELAGKETILQSISDKIVELEDKGSLINIAVEKEKCERIQAHFKAIASTIRNRKVVIGNDVEKWKEYIKRLEEMSDWVQSRKDLMDSEKPKDKQLIESQKQQLEVALPFFRIIGFLLRNFIFGFFMVLVVKESVVTLRFIAV